MVTYISLIAILAILCIVSYNIFKKDILSPSFISCIMFEISAVLACIGKYSWNDEESLSGITIGIVVIGMISFIIGEYILKKFFYKQKKEIEAKHSIIKIKKYKYFIMYLFVIVTIAFIVLELNRICQYYNYDSNNISDMLSFYRHKSVLYEDVLTRDHTDINFFVKQMHKVCVVIGFINIYIVINNFFYDEKKYKNSLNSLVIACICMGESLLTSGRALLMHYLIFTLFMVLFFIRKKYKISNAKLVVGSCISLLLMTISFYFIAPLLGRGASNGIIEYISFYFGTTIPSLNRFLQNIPEHSKYIGEETFTGVYLFLNKIKLISYTRSTAYGWQCFANGAGSNVYTSLRAYYFDFGFIGLICCQLLFGFVFSKLDSLKNRDNRYLIIYAYYFYVLIEQIRAEQFFYAMSTTTIAYIVLFVVMYKIIIGKGENQNDNIKGDILSLRDIQLEELNILKNTVKYLEKNNLEYYLAGGTLLGAVRHKGFIPWDDDIDICMPRNDYDKLIELCKENELGEEYELISFEMGNLIFPFAKIVNKNIFIKAKSLEDINLYIDVFPIDGYPEKYSKVIFQQRILNILKGILYLKSTSLKNIKNEKKSISNRILKILLKPIAEMIPTKWTSKIMIKMCKKYKYEECKYVGNRIWGYGLSEMLQKDKYASDKINIEFEDEEFKAPAGYDLYLKSIYGDYMKLPPKDKRVTHGIQAVKKIECNSNERKMK